MLVFPERLKTFVQNGENKPATEKAEKLREFSETLKQDINERIIMLVK